MGWNFRLIWTGKEEEKLSLFADNMILYTGSPKKLRTVRHWQKKLKTTQTDGKVYHLLYQKNSCFNEHAAQSNVQIRYNPYQNTKGIFHKTRTNNLKICLEIQTTLNSQNNLEKEQSWRYHTLWLQTILQS